jgi:hypothetical protein
MPNGHFKLRHTRLSRSPQRTTARLEFFVRRNLEQFSKWPGIRWHQVRSPPCTGSSKQGSSKISHGTQASGNGEQTHLWETHRSSATPQKGATSTPEKWPIPPTCWPFYEASTSETPQTPRWLPGSVSQPHFGLSVRVKPTLPKVGTWSPPGLPKIQSSSWRAKTLRIGVFLVSLERSWSVDV